jgi:hypothetical protein
MRKLASVLLVAAFAVVAFAASPAFAEHRGAALGHPDVGHLGGVAQSQHVQQQFQNADGQRDNRQVFVNGQWFFYWQVTCNDQFGNVLYQGPCQDGVTGGE